MVILGMGFGQFQRTGGYINRMIHMVKFNALFVNVSRMARLKFFPWLALYICRRATYTKNTTIITTTGINMEALKLSKKSYFTRHPTPDTEIKSKLNGVVNRSIFKNPFGHGISNAVSDTLSIWTKPMKDFMAALTDCINCFKFFNCCRSNFLASALLFSRKVLLARLQ